MASHNLCISKKKSGDICNKPGKFNIDDNYYCGIHFKKISKKDNNLNEVTNSEKNINVIKVDNIIDNEFIYIKNIIESKINFKINNCINNNTLGDYYLVTNTDSNKQYIMKLLYHKKNNSQILKRYRDLLFWEYMILSKHFTNNSNVVKLYDIKASYLSINDEIYYIVLLIMEYYSDSLNDRINRLKIFNENQIKSYGIQLINTIKELHNKGYIYINFNLNNLIFKNTNTEIIIYNNFQLCEKYIDIKGIHIEQKKLNNTTGTDMFSSIYCNSCRSSDRVGDIQSIGYILLYLYNGKLPWSTKKSPKSILLAKKNIIESTTFIESPKYLKDFIIESYNYNYSDKPYYSNFITYLS